MTIESFGFIQPLLKDIVPWDISVRIPVHNMLLKVMNKYWKKKISVGKVA